MSGLNNTIAHVECAVRVDSKIEKAVLRELIHKVLTTSVCSFHDGPISLTDHPELSKHLESMEICDIGPGISVSYWKVNLRIHLFHLVEVEAQKDFLESTDTLPACEQWMLPCYALSSDLWNSIIVKTHIKQQLVGYAASSSIFSDCQVDKNIITWNRMILLHGPPGTG